MNLKSYVISPEDTVLHALSKIDQNQKGFLIVCGEDDLVQGTLTDGDIRRAFLSGISMNGKVKQAYRSDYTSLNVKSNVTAAIDIFKNQSIQFLPIVDDKQQLQNILTKNQMQSLLLQDIHADLKYDFQLLDDTITDHEIFQRPWGFYKTTMMNEYCQSKVICVYPHGQLSLQSHDRREEHWVIAHGTGTVQIGESILEARCGNSFFIPKGCKHRLINTSDTENLIFTEVQIGDYFGEDDITRYEDIYGRK